MGKMNFNNEVIFIHGNICVVLDDYENLYYVDNGGIADAYEIGDCVCSEDLTPLSQLEDEQLRNTIYDELN